jgi:hypothetical protein
MNQLRVKEIKFHSPLKIMGDGEEIKGKIYRFYLAVKNKIIIGRASDINYLCFYCFKGDFINSVKLEDGVLQKIIEAEIYGIDGIKFITEENMPLQRDSYGITDSIYEKNSYTGKWNEDQYFDKWVAINACYKFEKFTLRFMDLDSGRLFYWKNVKNISIALPEFPYNLLKK